jgi:hypothetical protein
MRRGDQVLIAPPFIVYTARIKIIVERPECVINAALVSLSDEFS